MVDSTAVGSLEEVVFPSSRLKAFLLFLGALGFVALGLWMRSSTPDGHFPQWKVAVTVYVGIPFFGLCALAAAWMFLVNRPVAVADRRGITITGALSTSVSMEWHEVERLVLYRYRSQVMLGVVPKSLEVLAARQSVVTRALSRGSLSMGFAPLNVGAATVRGSLRDLAAQVRDRFGVPLDDREER